ncbi:MAG: hypothetical protein COZ65_01490 [Caldiserica bacterium CG_4_8_14_3_um_filter_35_18]|nr:MAG: hypothetical protein COW37_02360 [Caldiserica bacterium CG17_big_fil_post_rev_8_21_14_2_50_35_7]PIX29596.1 MAG: hypothetical protein COZ65_01490 [Caldiserica bacterium CG_4_8_14_3_um_filter_35_18]
MEKITIDEFKKRLIDLCVRSNLEYLPRKIKDKRILFKSIVSTLEPGKEYSEKEINDKLKLWLEKVNQNAGINHVILRRSLIDEGYLVRKINGSEYYVNISDLVKNLFESGIEKVNVFEIIDKARQEIEDRRKKYMVF